MTDPASIACPACHAEPGAKCRDYRGRNCAPHRERTAMAHGVTRAPAAPTPARAPAQALDLFADAAQSGAVDSLDEPADFARQVRVGRAMAAAAAQGDHREWPANPSDRDLAPYEPARPNPETVACRTCRVQPGQACRYADDPTSDRFGIPHTLRHMDVEALAEGRPLPHLDSIPPVEPTEPPRPSGSWAHDDDQPEQEGGEAYASDWDEAEGLEEEQAPDLCDECLLPAGPDHECPADEEEEIEAEREALAQAQKRAQREVRDDAAWAANDAFRAAEGGRCGWCGQHGAGHRPMADGATCPVAKAVARREARAVTGSVPAGPFPGDVIRAEREAAREPGDPLSYANEHGSRGAWECPVCNLHTAHVPGNEFCLDAQAKLAAAEVEADETAGRDDWTWACGHIAKGKHAPHRFLGHCACGMTTHWACGSKARDSVPCRCDGTLLPNDTRSPGDITKLWEAGRRLQACADAGQGVLRVSGFQAAPKPHRTASPTSRKPSTPTSAPEQGSLFARSTP